MYSLTNAAIFSLKKRRTCPGSKTRRKRSKQAKYLMERLRDDEGEASAAISDEDAKDDGDDDQVSNDLVRC